MQSLFVPLILGLIPVFLSVAGWSVVLNNLLLLLLQDKTTHFKSHPCINLYFGGKGFRFWEVLTVDECRGHISPVVCDSLRSPDDSEDGERQNDGPRCSTNQSSQNASVYVQSLTPLTGVVGALAWWTPEKQKKY